MSISRTSATSQRLRRMSIVAAASVACLLAPTLARAQAIGGTVTDTTGGVLPGVTVEARSPALIEQVRTTVTDGNGQYLIVALETGTYNVTFTLPGFSTLIREGVAAQHRDSPRTSTRQLAVGSLEETVIGHRGQPDHRRPERPAERDDRPRGLRGAPDDARLRLAGAAHPRHEHPGRALDRGADRHGRPERRAQQPADHPRLGRVRRRGPRRRLRRQLRGVRRRARGPAAGYVHRGVRLRLLVERGRGGDGRRADEHDPQGGEQPVHRRLLRQLRALELAGQQRRPGPDRPRHHRRQGRRVQGRSDVAGRPVARRPARARPPVVLRELHLSPGQLLPVGPVQQLGHERPDLRARPRQPDAGGVEQLRVHAGASRGRRPSAGQDPGLLRQQQRQADARAHRLAALSALHRPGGRHRRERRRSIRTSSPGSGRIPTASCSRPATRGCPPTASCIRSTTSSAPRASARTSTPGPTCRACSSSAR